MPDTKADYDQGYRDGHAQASATDPDAAVEYLIRSAPKLAKAEADVQRAKYLLGHVEALEFLAAEGSVKDREAAARTGKAYVEASQVHVEAVAEFRKIKSEREAAAIKIDVWRTRQASQRAEQRAVDGR